jgi:hypothetical protein
MTLFFWFVVGHCLADYPLQGDFLARAKDRHNKSMGFFPWQVALAAHALIHAGFVAALTGSIALGMAEFVAHCIIDFAKCEKWLGGWTKTLVLNPYDPAHMVPEQRALWIDQALHIACKILWVVLL